MTAKIEPRCKLDMNQVYISADGQVMNCCWMGNYPHVEHYFEFFEDQLKLLNVNQYPLEQILKSGLLQQIEATWSSENPFPPCIKFCSKPTQTNTEQLYGTNEVKKIDHN